VRRRRATLVAVALALLALLGPTGASTAPGGERRVVVDTEVSIEQVADDEVFPFDEPQPGEAVFVRITATSEGPATAKKGEIWVAATVVSEERPSIRGRRGVRCDPAFAVESAWVALCANSGVFRDGAAISMLLRIEAQASRIQVRGYARKSRTAGSDLVVKSGKDGVAIDVADSCRNPWDGRWRRIEHAGTMEIVQRNGQIQRFSYDWFDAPGDFFDLKLGDDGRAMTGKDRTPAGRPVSFGIRLADDGRSFNGTYSFTDAAGGGGGFSATRIGTDSCPGG
jgi:hypothetical protein